MHALQFCIHGLFSNPKLRALRVRSLFLFARPLPLISSRSTYSSGQHFTPQALALRIDARSSRADVHPRVLCTLLPSRSTLRDQCIRSNVPFARSLSLILS
jgi:hypothetical protein